MKLKGAKQVHYDSGPNMTPLVDVVMVILIFLMLAGSFGATSHYLTSNLPITKGGVGAEAKPGEVPDEIFEVQIVSDPNHGFRVNAGSIKSQGRTPDRDWLAEEFRKKKDAYDASGGTPGEAIQVVISPAGSVRYDHIALVYEAALKAQFKKVAFRTAQ